MPVAAQTGNEHESSVNQRSDGANDGSQHRRIPRDTWGTRGQVVALSAQSRSPPGRPTEASLDALIGDWVSSDGEDDCTEMRSGSDSGCEPDPDITNTAPILSVHLLCEGEGTHEPDAATSSFGRAARCRSTDLTDATGIHPQHDSNMLPRDSGSFSAPQLFNNCSTVPLGPCCAVSAPMPSLGTAATASASITAAFEAARVSLITAMTATITAAGTATTTSMTAFPARGGLPCQPAWPSGNAHPPWCLPNDVLPLQPYQSIAAAAVAPAPFGPGPPCEPIPPGATYRCTAPSARPSAAPTSDQPTADVAPLASCMDRPWGSQPQYSILMLAPSSDAVPTATTAPGRLVEVAKTGGFADDLAAAAAARWGSLHDGLFVAGGPRSTSGWRDDAVETASSPLPRVMRPPQQPGLDLGWQGPAPSANSGAFVAAAAATLGPFGETDLGRLLQLPDRDPAAGCTRADQPSGEVRQVVLAELLAGHAAGAWSTLGWEGCGPPSTSGGEAGASGPPLRADSLLGPLPSLRPDTEIASGSSSLAMSGLALSSGPAGPWAGARDSRVSHSSADAVSRGPQPSPSGGPRGAQQYSCMDFDTVDRHHFIEKFGDQQIPGQQRSHQQQQQQQGQQQGHLQQALLDLHLRRSQSSEGAGFWHLSHSQPYDWGMDLSSERQQHHRQRHQPRQPRVFLSPSGPAAQRQMMAQRECRTAPLHQLVGLERRRSDLPYSPLLERRGVGLPATAPGAAQAETGGLPHLPTFPLGQAFRSQPYRQPNLSHAPLAVPALVAWAAAGSTPRPYVSGLQLGGSTQRSCRKRQGCGRGGAPSTASHPAPAEAAGALRAQVMRSSGSKSSFWAGVCSARGSSCVEPGREALLL